MVLDSETEDSVNHGESRSSRKRELPLATRWPRTVREFNFFFPVFWEERLE